MDSKSNLLLMKAASITLLIFSLILPVVGFCDAELDAAGLHSGLKLSVKSSDPDASEYKIVREAVEDESVRWHPRAGDTQLEGVALVIHGLNCRPDKMGAIIAILNASGIDCLNLSLRGHGTNFSPIDDMSPDAARMVAFKSVSYPLWKAEATLDFSGSPLQALHVVMENELAARAVSALDLADINKAFAALDVDTALIPLPPAVLLFGSALGFLVAFGRRRLVGSAQS